MSVHTRKMIDEFLAQKRIAFVGLSRNQKDFSRMLFAEFARRGYDLIPVNPNATEIEGRQCVGRISMISPPPEAALLLTSAKVLDPLLEDCVHAGVKRVWIYGYTGKSVVSDAAIEVCREQGIEVIAGECPFMFLPNTQWFHRLHGRFNKIIGTYPVAS